MSKYQVFICFVFMVYELVNLTSFPHSFGVGCIELECYFFRIINKSEYASFDFVV